jgi:hypothetical protein
MFKATGRHYKTGLTKHEKAERDLQITAKWLSGVSMSRLGEEYNLNEGTVRYIIYQIRQAVVAGPKTPDNPKVQKIAAALEIDLESLNKENNNG